MTTPSPAEVLRTGAIRPLGRIMESSNGAVLVELALADQRLLAIHKPVAFERPLWDYPDGHLVHRERAAYLISAAGRFGTVPPTVLREGPWGPGSVQEWIGTVTDRPEPVVTVCEPGECPQGWLVVLSGEDQEGHEVVLAHADDPGLRSAAVLDAVLNNSDRKGGHLVRVAGQVHGFDHGVALGVEPKLRTVLWGWAGQPLPVADLDRLERLEQALDDPDGPLSELPELLTPDELEALRGRVGHLRRSGRHPVPHAGWPAIPWPAM